MVKKTFSKKIKELEIKLGKEIEPLEKFKLELTNDLINKLDVISLRFRR